MTIGTEEADDAILTGVALPWRWYLQLPTPTCWYIGETIYCDDDGNTDVLQRGQLLLALRSDDAEESIPQQCLYVQFVRRDKKDNTRKNNI